MKIAFFGSGEFGIECLTAVKSSGHNLVLVVTSPPCPAGRGQKLNPTAIAKWARSNSIPLLEAWQINAPDTIQRIADCRPDLNLVIACGQKISRRLVELPPRGSINVHASLLPKYRGAAPINWAIINGEKETGISIITLAEKMDAGKIIAQSKTQIAPDEAADSLHDRLAKLSAPLLLETLDKIDKGTAVYIEQDHSKATLAPKLSKSDGNIDFGEPAQILERKIRGFWPWPGASANYISKETNKSLRVTFARAKVVVAQNPSGVAPGTLDENLNIICADNALRIIKIKPSGSNLMDFSSFINGRNTKPGDSFAKIS
jgi:methionyl-tRNA formyltransferase